MIRKTTKKEIRRIRSLRKSGVKIEGFYFVAPNQKAYRADTLSEQIHFLKDQFNNRKTQLDLF